MAKIIKKKFYEVDLPLVSEKYEAYAGSIEELKDKAVKLDITRKLRGKNLDLDFKIAIKDGKAVGIPKKLTLMPFFIKHMLHAGIDYIEDSIEAETKESKVIIKPFLITRKKVSRAVRRTLRNSAKNWIIDYLKTKNDNEIFEEILSNQLQKPLSLKLKKVYPLAICEIRVFEVKKSLGNIVESPSIINTEKEEVKEAVKEENEDESRAKAKKLKEDK
jgi:ribosomal protein S3AE